MKGFILKCIDSCIPKKRNRLLYSSFPDIADNSFAFFIYVLNNQVEYENIWLVKDLNNIKRFENLISKYSESKNYKIVKKISLLGFYYFFSSKYIFYTHGLFNAFPLSTKQTVVNFWHGMPLKVIGLLDGKKEFLKSHYVIATSTMFQDIMSRACGIDKKNVLVLGQPRNEFLLEPKATLNELFAKKSSKDLTTVLWMPTYRKSTFGEIREDGDLLDDDLMSTNNLETLNEFLKKSGANCFIKLHPMDVNTVDSFREYSNLVFLDNESFNHKNLNMYSCFASVDILLTDYSSIYMDLLILDKPVGFVINDFKSYKNSRGFTIDNPLDYMPGEIIYDNKDLITFLHTSILLKEDKYAAQRAKINLEFNEVYKKSSERIFNTIILKSSELN